MLYFEEMSHNKHLVVVILVVVISAGNIPQIIFRNAVEMTVLTRMHKPNTFRLHGSDYRRNEFMFFFFIMEWYSNYPELTFSN